MIVREIESVNKLKFKAGLKTSTTAGSLLVEHCLQRNPEHFGDEKCYLERWRVFPQFDRVDGLARDSDAVGQRLLSHFGVLLAQLPNAITDPARHIRARA
jgi:hypothetical protein